MPWYPGQVAIGQKVFGDVVGMSKGFWSQPPVITTPGTPASSPGTVTNNTGFDVMVYMSAATGIGKIVVNGGTIGTGGTVTAANIPTDFYLASGQTAVLTYTGLPSWTWLAV
jgi:hypothetical protein